MDKIVIYDTETSNSHIFGSIIEFGAVVVDKNLNEKFLSFVSEVTSRGESSFSKSTTSKLYKY